MKKTNIHVLSDDNELPSLLGQHVAVLSKISADIHIHHHSDSEALLAECEYGAVVVLNCVSAYRDIVEQLNEKKINSIICLLPSDSTDEHADLSFNILKLPIRLVELVTLISKLIDQTQKIVSKLKWGKFTLDIEHDELHQGSTTTPLTQKETAIIALLYDAQPNAVSKEQLLEKIWGYNSQVNTHTLETHVYRLRQKIISNDDFIITSNDGYSLHV